MYTDYESRFITVLNNECTFEVKTTHGTFTDSGLLGQCFKGIVQGISEPIVIYAYTLADIEKNAVEQMNNIINTTLPMVENSDTISDRVIVFSCGDSFIRRVFKE